MFVIITKIFKSIIFSSNMNSGMNSPGAAAASCNMKDSGSMKHLITIMAPPWSRIRFCSYPLSFMLQLATAVPWKVMPLIHVAGADMDATYGAYVAAEEKISMAPAQG